MRYKALLVDDEKFVITHLRSCIDWATFDIEVVGDAYDGEEALIKTRHLNPDIVITDIVMPNMTGLEYLERLHASNNRVQVIILSGHQNFEFAKKAIAYGVVDYIVKPSRLSDIVSALNKAVKTLHTMEASAPQGPAASGANPTAADCPQAVRDLLNHINNHYSEPLTVHSLSKKFYLTPNYISALFKKYVGSGIAEYLQSLRIERAKWLLANCPDMKAYEIAKMVGYDDYELFRKTFKKLTDINPNEFRNV